MSTVITTDTVESSTGQAKGGRSSPFAAGKTSRNEPKYRPPSSPVPSNYVPVVPEPRPTGTRPRVSASSDAPISEQRRYSLQQQARDYVEPLLQAGRAGLGQLSEQQVSNEISNLCQDITFLESITGVDNHATQQFFSALSDESATGAARFAQLAQEAGHERRRYTIPPGPVRVMQALLNAEYDVDRNLEQVVSLTSKLAIRLVHHHNDMVERAEEEVDPGQKSMCLLTSQMFLTGACFYAPQRSAFHTFLQTKVAYDLTKSCLAKVFEVLRWRINLCIQCERARVDYTNRAFTLRLASHGGPALSIDDYYNLLMVNLLPAVESMQSTKEVYRMARETRRKLRQLIKHFENVKKEKAFPISPPNGFGKILSDTHFNLLYRQPGDRGEIRFDLFHHQRSQPIVFSTDLPEDNEVLRAHMKVLDLVKNNDNLKTVVERSCAGAEPGVLNVCRLSFDGGIKILGSVVSQLKAEVNNAQGMFTWRNAALRQITTIKERAAQYGTEVEKAGAKEPPNERDDVISELKTNYVNDMVGMNDEMAKEMESGDSFSNAPHSRRKCTHVKCQLEADPSEGPDVVQCRCGRFRTFSQLRISTKEQDPYPYVETVPSSGSLPKKGKSVTWNEMIQVKSTTPSSTVSDLSTMAASMNLGDQSVLATEEDQRIDSDEDSGSEDDLLADTRLYQTAISSPGVSRSVVGAERKPLTNEFMDEFKNRSKQMTDRINLHVNEAARRRNDSPGQRRRFVAPAFPPDRPDSPASVRSLVDGGDEAALAQGDSMEDLRGVIDRQTIFGASDLKSKRTKSSRDRLEDKFKQDPVPPRRSDQQNLLSSAFNDWGQSADTTRSREALRQIRTGPPRARHKSPSSDGYSSEGTSLERKPVKSTNWNQNAFPPSSNEMVPRPSDSLFGPYNSKNWYYNPSTGTGPLAPGVNVANMGKERAPVDYWGINGIYGGGDAAGMFTAAGGGQPPQGNGQSGRGHPDPGRPPGGFGPPGGGGAGGGAGGGGFDGNGPAGPGPPGPPGGGGGRGPSQPPDDDGDSSDEDIDPLDRQLARDIEEARNSGRPQRGINIGDEEYNHIRLMLSLEREMRVNRREIRREFEKRGLFPLLAEGADIRENPILHALSEQAIAMLQRLERDAQNLLKEATRATISPYCSEQYVRSAVNVHIRPISRSLKKHLGWIGTVLNGHKRYLEHRKEQEKTALSECGKVLTLEMEPWDGKQSYLFYMLKFLQSQEFIADERAKFLRLERAMSKFERARRIMTYFTNSRQYSLALQELNSVFGSTRDAWSDAIRSFESLPGKIITLHETRQLHSAIRSLRSYLDIFFPLNQFISDQFIMRAVFYRLAPAEQQRLVRRKRKYDNKTQEEAIASGAIEIPKDCSYVHYVLNVYNKEYIAFDREMTCLQESARQDLVSSQSLSRQQITGSRVRDKTDQQRRVNNNASNSTVHQQQPRRPKGRGRGRGSANDGHAKDRPGREEQRETTASTNFTSTKGNPRFKAKPGARSRGRSQSRNQSQTRDRTQSRSQSRGRGQFRDRSRAQSRGPSRDRSQTRGKAGQGRGRSKSDKRGGSGSSKNRRSETPALTAYSCKICKQSKCQSQDKSPLACDLLRKAKDSTDKKIKKQAVEKMFGQGVCPTCAGSWSAGHHCPPTLIAFGKEYPIDKLQCRRQCSERGIILSKFLCPCGKARQGKSNAGKKNVNVLRIVHMSEYNVNATGPQVSRPGNQTKILHWEEISQQVGAEGQKLPVCFSLDTCADQSLVDKESFQKLVHPSTVRTTSFQLQTANATKHITSREGFMDLRLGGGDIIQLLVLEIPDVGPENILRKRKVADVVIPSEARDHVDVSARQVLAQAHVLIGQDVIVAFPGHKIWQSPSRKAGIRTSSLNTDSGVLEGEWDLNQPKLQVNNMSILRCYPTGVLEEKIEDVRAEKFEQAPGIANVLGSRNPKPTKVLPIPLGSPVSNQGHLPKVVAARQFPPETSSLVLPHNHSYWFPRLYYDENVPGDSATCYFQSRSDRIPSKIKHRGLCSSAEQLAKLCGDEMSPPLLDDDPRSDTPYVCRECEVHREILGTPADITRNDGIAAELYEDLLLPRKEVRFGDVNVLEIPYDPMLADVLLGTEKLESVAEMRERKAAYKRVRDKLEEEVAVETGGQKRLKTLRRLKSAAYNHPTNPAYQKYRGGKLQGIAKQINLLENAQKRLAGGRTFVLPDHDPAEGENLSLVDHVLRNAEDPNNGNEHWIDEATVKSFAEARAGLKLAVEDIDWLDESYGTWFRELFPRRKSAPYGKAVDVQSFGVYKFVTTNRTTNTSYMRDRVVEPCRREGGGPTGFDPDQTWPQPNYPKPSTLLWLQDQSGEWCLGIAEKMSITPPTDQHSILLWCWTREGVNNTNVLEPAPGDTSKYEGSKLMYFCAGDPKWKIVDQNNGGNVTKMKYALLKRRDKSEMHRDGLGTLPPANVLNAEDRGGRVPSPDASQLLTKNTEEVKKINNCPVGVTEIGSTTYNPLLHPSHPLQKLRPVPISSYLTAAHQWDGAWSFFREAMEDEQEDLSGSVNANVTETEPSHRKVVKGVSKTWPVESCHRCVEDNLLNDGTDLTCFASKIHKRGNLFGELDAGYLKKLTPRDRLHLTFDDPLSLYKGGGPAVCGRCEKCACQRNIRDFYRAQRQQAMLDGNVRLDVKNKRFVVDDIVNEEMDGVDEKSARREALARARNVHRSCARRGKLPLFLKEFQKQLDVGYFSTTENAEAAYPELLKLPKAYQLVNYAIKAGASEQEINKDDNPLDSKTKIRMVSDLSMEALDLQGKKRIAVNHGIESGYSRLPFICEIYERFLFGEDVTVSDVDKAFYSIGLSCASMNRTRFFFSLDPRPDPPPETFYLYLQKVCSMGSESSQNHLLSAIEKVITDPKLTKLDPARFKIDMVSVYADDILNSEVKGNIVDNELAPVTRSMVGAIATKRALDEFNLHITSHKTSGVGLWHPSNHKDRPDPFHESIDVLEQILLDTNLATEEDCKRLEQLDKSELPENQPYQPHGHFVSRLPEHTVEKFLGVFWDVLADSFRFKCDVRPFSSRVRGQRAGTPWTDPSPEEILKLLRSKPFTRRALASVHGSFFDLLKQVQNAALNIAYKLGQRKIMQRFVEEDKLFGWSEILTEKELEHLVTPISDSLKLAQIQFPRHEMCPDAKKHLYQKVLVGQSDASDRLTGAACWLVEVPVNEYQQFTHQLTQGPGLLKTSFNGVKIPPPTFEEKKTFGKVCLQCEKDEEQYRLTGRLPHNFTRPDNTHTHTLNGVKSTRMGRWLQALAARKIQRTEYVQNAEHILGKDYRKLIPRANGEWHNYCQLLATRQQIGHASSGSSQMYECAGVADAASFMTWERDVLEGYFQEPIPMFLMTDSKTTISLCNSDSYFYGFSNVVLSKVVRIQQALTRQDAHLLFVPGCQNASDYLTKIHSNSTEYAVSAFRHGNQLHLPIMQWQCEPARQINAPAGDKKSTKSWSSVFFDNNLSRKSSQLQLDPDTIKKYKGPSKNRVDREESRRCTATQCTLCLSDDSVAAGECSGAYSPHGAGAVVYASQTGSASDIIDDSGKNYYQPDLSTHLPGHQHQTGRGPTYNDRLLYCLPQCQQYIKPRALTNVGELPRHLLQQTKVENSTGQNMRYPRNTYELQNSGYEKKQNNDPYLRSVNPALAAGERAEPGRVSLPATDTASRPDPVSAPGSTLHCCATAYGGGGDSEQNYQPMEQEHNETGWDGYVSDGSDIPSLCGSSSSESDWSGESDCSSDHETVSDDSGVEDLDGDWSSSSPGGALNGTLECVATTLFRDDTPLANTWMRRGLATRATNLSKSRPRYLVNASMRQTRVERRPGRNNIKHRDRKGGTLVINGPGLLLQRCLTMLKDTIAKYKLQGVKSLPVYEKIKSQNQGQMGGLSGRCSGSGRRPAAVAALTMSETRHAPAVRHSINHDRALLAAVSNSRNAGDGRDCRVSGPLSPCQGPRTRLQQTDSSQQQGQGDAHHPQPQSQTFKADDDWSDTFLPRFVNLEPNNQGAQVMVPRCQQAQEYNDQSVNIPEEAYYPRHSPGDQPNPDLVHQSRHEDEQIQRVFVTKIVEERRRPGQRKAFAVDVQLKKARGERDSRFVSSCSAGLLREQCSGEDIAPLRRIKLVSRNEPNGHDVRGPDYNDGSSEQETLGHQCNAYHIADDKYCGEWAASGGPPIGQEQSMSRACVLPDPRLQRTRDKHTPCDSSRFSPDTIPMFVCALCTDLMKKDEDARERIHDHLRDRKWRASYTIASDMDEDELRFAPGTDDTGTNVQVNWTSPRLDQSLDHITLSSRSLGRIEGLKHVNIYNGCKVLNLAGPGDWRSAVGETIDEQVRELECRDTRCFWNTISTDTCSPDSSSPAPQCNAISRGSRAAGEAPYDQGRRLLNIELFCETLSTSRIGINRFLTGIAKCLCLWMSRLPKYMELKKFSKQQEMKLRLFHLMIVSLAPATRFLLSSRHAIRRSVWFSRGLYFKLCRPRLNDEHAAEVLVIPGRSMLAMAILRDVHDRHHGQTVATMRVEVDNLYVMLPDTVSDVLEELTGTCAKCRKYKPRARKGKKPVAVLPLPPSSPCVSVMSHVSLDSMGPMLVRASVKSKENMKMYITAVRCLYSRLVQLYPHFGMTQEDFKSVITQQCSRWGTPNTITMDNLASQVAVLKELSKKNLKKKKLDKDDPDLSVEQQKLIQRVVGQANVELRYPMDRVVFDDRDVKDVVARIGSNLDVTASFDSSHNPHGENVFLPTQHIVQTVANQPGKTVTITEAQGIIAAAEYEMNNRPFSIMRKAGEFSTLTPAQIACPNSVALSSDDRHILTQLLLTQQFKKARNLLAKTYKSMMTLLSDYLWRFATGTIDEMKVHEQQVEFGVGDYCILLDSLYKATFWNRCKIGQIEAIGLNRNNSEKYAVCRVMVNSGRVDPGDPERGCPPHPIYRPCYVLRNLSSLSLPLVRGKEIRAMKTCEDLVDLDSRYWTKFTKFLTERDWNEEVRERAKYVLPPFTESVPISAKPAKDYIIKFDPKLRAFRLKMTQSDWDRIFDDPHNEWPDVNVGYNDEDGEFGAFDDWIANQDFEDDTPDPRITRAGAEEEHDRERYLHDEAGDQVDAQVDAEDLRGDNDHLPDQEDEVDEVAQHDDDDVEHVVVGDDDREEESEEQRRQKEAFNENLDNWEKNHAKICQPGERTPLMFNTPIDAFNSTLTQNFWPSAGSTFHFALDGWSGHKPAKVISVDRRGRYKFKVETKTFTKPLFLGQSNWSNLPPFQKQRHAFKSRVVKTNRLKSEARSKMDKKTTSPQHWNPVSVKEEGLKTRSGSRRRQHFHRQVESPNYKKQMEDGILKSSRSRSYIKKCVSFLVLLAVCVPVSDARPGAAAVVNVKESRWSTARGEPGRPVPVTQVVRDTASLGYTHSRVQRGVGRKQTRWDDWFQFSSVNDDDRNFEDIKSGSNRQTDASEEIDEGDEVTMANVTEKNGGEILSTFSITEVLGKVKTFRTGSRLCLDPQMLSQEYKKTLEATQSRQFRQWVRTECAPPFLLSQLDPVRNIERGFHLTEDNVGNLHAFLRDVGLDNLGRYIDTEAKFLDRSIGRAINQSLYTGPVDRGKSSPRQVTEFHGLSRPEEGDPEKRPKRSPILDINLSLNFINRGELNLFKHQYQYQRMNQVLGQYNERTETAINNQPTYAGAPIWAAGTLLGKGAPGVSDQIKGDGKTCEYYLAVYCALREDVESDAMARSREVKRDGGKYEGLTLVESAYSGDVPNAVTMSIPEHEETIEFMKFVEDEEPDELERFDEEELPRKATIHTCISRARLKNNFKELVARYQQYSDILAFWSNRTTIPFHSYVNENRCSVDNTDCSVETVFITKGGGDRSWSLFKGRDSSGQKIMDKWQAPENGDVGDPLRNCQWFGGTPFYPGALTSAQLRSICGADQLNCGYLVFSQSARGRHLYNSDGSPTSHQELEKQLRPVFYNESDPSVQNTFNMNPYLLMILGGDTTSNNDVYLPYIGHAGSFPVHATSRSLCLLQGARNTAAYASNLLLTHSTDLQHGNIVDTDEFKERINHLDSVIKTFNDEKTQYELDNKIEDDCEEVVLPVLNYEDSMSNMESDIGIGVDKLALLVDDIKVLFRAKMRDPFPECPQCDYTEVEKYRPHVKKLEKVIKAFLKMGGKLFEKIDAVSDALPKSGKDLKLTDSGQDFGDWMEKIGISSTGAVGAASVVLNVLLGTYYGGLKALFNKITGQRSTRWLKPFGRWAEKAAGKLPPRTESFQRASGEPRRAESVPMIEHDPDNWHAEREGLAQNNELTGLNRLIMNSKMNARNTPHSSLGHLSVGPGAPQAPPYTSRDAVHQYRA